MEEPNPYPVLPKQDETCADQCIRKGYYIQAMCYILENSKKNNI